MTKRKKQLIQDLYHQFTGTMEDWQLKMAIARMLHFNLPQATWEDTLQDLVVTVMSFKFDADKARAASEQTVLCRHMDNCIRMLARSNARRVKRLKRLGRMGYATQDTHTPDVIAMHAEINCIIATLPPLEQDICRMLMEGLNAHGVAQETGLHYTTVCRHVQQIRQSLADGGFDEWSA